MIFFSRFYLKVLIPLLYFFCSPVLAVVLEASDAHNLVDDNGLAVIPDTYTSIAVGAFRNSNVVSVVIPGSIDVIERDAFYSTPLTHVSMENGITTINYNVFRNTNIKTVILPDSVSYIGDNVFSDTPLESVILSESLLEIPAYAFSNTKLNSVTLPDSVETIRSYAFSNSSLEKVILGTSLTTIGDHAFESNENLSDINIGNTIQDIGAGAFRYCGLVTVEIPSSITKIKASVFSDNPLVEVTLHDAITEIGQSSFFRNQNLTSIELPQSLITVGSYAFDGSGLTSIVIPDSVTEINRQSFNAYNLERVVLGKSLTTLGYRAFGVNSLKTLIIYSPLSDVDEQAFGRDYELANKIEEIFLIEPADWYVGQIDYFNRSSQFFNVCDESDYDEDEIINCLDDDSDNDGALNNVDAFPLDETEINDSDLDGVGDNLDVFPFNADEYLDTDGDGVGDNQDVFPNNPNESQDDDLDGIGNNDDPDDDNDGTLDVDDAEPSNPLIGDQPAQIISVSGSPKAVSGYELNIDISYEVSDGINQLPGIGFRVHFNSQDLTFVSALDALIKDIIVSAEGPFSDYEDHDNDQKTDEYISFGWASIAGDWPDASLPAKLFTLNFDVRNLGLASDHISSSINFSKLSTTEGYGFNASDYDFEILLATWDFDGNSSADALTDGLLLMRYLFDLRGESLTSDVIAPDATMSHSEIQMKMDSNVVIADIDHNGELDALTDGLLLMRYLFDLRGEALIDKVVSSTAERFTEAEIESYIKDHLP